MKYWQKWVIGLTALVIVGAGLLIGLFKVLSKPRRYPNRFDQHKFENRMALESVCMCLVNSPLNQPMGNNCKSLPEAVRFVTDQLHELSYVWESSHGRESTNGFIHLNPDWEKWKEAAKDERAHTNEIAAFCDDPCAGWDTKQETFTAVTFGLKFVEITNAPAWPRAIDWLK